ncbi:hypothetical protein QUF72_22615 [Desulfobacterales bacterium HSG2]|nr:hypothetical protein [Desulfobacterales bacterium HSG2]
MPAVFFQERTDLKVRGGAYQEQICHRKKKGYGRREATYEKTLLKFVVWIRVIVRW